jgi:hypothetical protein
MQPAREPGAPSPHACIVAALLAPTRRRRRNDLRENLRSRPAAVPQLVSSVAAHARRPSLSRCLDERNRLGSESLDESQPPAPRSPSGPVDRPDKALHPHGLVFCDLCLQHSRERTSLVPVKPYTVLRAQIKRLPAQRLHPREAHGTTRRISSGFPLDGVKERGEKVLVDRLAREPFSASLAAPPHVATLARGQAQSAPTTLVRPRRHADHYAPFVTRDQPALRR